jgi:hypothetical protein
LDDRGWKLANEIAEIITKDYGREMRTGEGFAERTKCRDQETRREFKSDGLPSSS